MGIGYLSPSSSPSMPPSSAVSIGTNRFSIGQPVEVANHPPGSYYEAIVISRLPNGSYVVRYHTLLNDDDNYSFLTRTVYPNDLRPLPPPIVVSPAGFSLNQTVDAFDREGWWVTTITRIIDSDYYFVYCDVVDRDVEFHSSELRVHQDWIGGRWVLP